MRDGIPIAAAIVTGFVLLSATVLYSADRIERKLQASIQQAQPSNDRPNPSETSVSPAGSVKVNAEGVRVDRVMTYDFFARYWRPDFAGRADRDCWVPLEKGRKTPLPAQVPFNLEVDADGSVVQVDQVAAEDPSDGTSELRTCLANIIRTMRFAPSGKRQKGPVQADRPIQK